MKKGITMKTVYKRLLIGLIFLGLIITLRMFRVGEYLSLEHIRHNSLHLLNFIESSYALSVVVFLSIIALVVMFAIPITPLLTLASGYFFGTFLGAMYSILGATLGATISFFTFRYLLGGVVEHRYSQMLEKFNRKFKQQGASYILFMQLLPITPFLVIVMITSVSTVSWWTFVWTTLVGIAPGSFIYAFAGKQLMSIEKISDILSWPIIIALSLLACSALVPLVIKKLKPSAQLE